MAKRMMAMILTLVMLLSQCVAAQAADFTTWNKGTILTDPVTYFGSDKYRFGGASDDRDADFSWNWVTYSFYSKGEDTQLKDGYAYAKKLEETGFFDIVEETSKEGRWEIRYIGKEKTIKPSKSGSSPEGKWHVLVYVNAGYGDNREFRVLLVDGIEFDGINNPKKEKVNSSSSSSKNSTSSGSSSKSSVSSSSSSWSSSSSSSKTRTKRCTKCGGDGKVSCSRCSGSGGKYVYISTPNYSGKSTTSSRKWENCSKCRGGGTQSCGTCGGDGKVEY